MSIFTDVCSYRGATFGGVCTAVFDSFLANFKSSPPPPYDLLAWEIWSACCNTSSMEKTPILSYFQPSVPNNWMVSCRALFLPLSNGDNRPVFHQASPYSEKFFWSRVHFLWTWRLLHVLSIVPYMRVVLMGNGLACRWHMWHNSTSSWARRDATARRSFSPETSRRNSLTGYVRCSLFYLVYIIRRRPDGFNCCRSILRGTLIVTCLYTCAMLLSYHLISPPVTAAKRPWKDSPTLSKFMFLLW